MDIDWSGCEEHVYDVDYYPEPNELAVEAAKSHLRESGHGGSLIKLIKNETLEEFSNAETDWNKFMRGRALFQVTLIRDPPEERDELEIRRLAERLSSFDSLGASAASTMPMADIHASVAPPTTANPVATRSSMDDASGSKLSQFADADESTRVLLREEEAHA